VAREVDGQSSSGEGGKLAAELCSEECIVAFTHGGVDGWEEVGWMYGRWLSCDSGRVGGEGKVGQGVEV
jgi:hypothetical protein